MRVAHETGERRRSVGLVPQAMLVAGILLLLIGLGWSLPPLIASLRPAPDSDAGAVLLATTASPTRQPAVATPAAGLNPTLPVTVTAGPTSAPTITPTPMADERPERIVAPAIDLDARVTAMGWQTINYKGKTWNEWLVPEDTAGWLVTSAPPGRVGNTVLTGHHNIHAKVFRYVVDLEPGDEITVFTGRRAVIYVVTEKYILKEAGMPSEVRRKNAQWIVPTDDERLTLVTCWPFEWPGNTHRVIVVAKPVPATP